MIRVRLKEEKTQTYPLQYEGPRQVLITSEKQGKALSDNGNHGDFGK